MRVFRCWWCLEFLNRASKDCGQKDCIETRRSGAWKKRKPRRSVNKKPREVLWCQ